MIVSATIALFAVLAGGPTDGRASLTIVVDDAGTRVHNRGSTDVIVTSNEGKQEGKSERVQPGRQYETANASAPPPPPLAPAPRPRAKPPAAPVLLSPGDREAVKTRLTDKGLGPVVLSWSPVAGVREYEVELQVDNGKPTVLKAQRAEIKLPPLPPGKVSWMVRSVAEGGTAESSRRWFDLQPISSSWRAGPPGGSRRRPARFIGIACACSRPSCC